MRREVVKNDCDLITYTVNDSQWGIINICDVEP